MGVPLAGVPSKVYVRIPPVVSVGVSLGVPSKVSVEIPPQVPVGFPLRVPLKAPVGVTAEVPDASVGVPPQSCSESCYRVYPESLSPESP